MTAMVKKRRGLGGLGVDVLLSAASSNRSAEQPDAPAELATGGEFKHIPVEQIHRGRYQPRIHMRDAALEDLANSIRAQGVVQPVVVRPAEDGYELIAGERRWRASQLAGLDVIPAIIKEVPDQAAAAMALIENIQREDLNPLEEATAIHRLINKFELTHQEIATSVGRSRATVSNLLRLLELTDEVKHMIDDGDLDMGHARALLGLAGAQQIEAAQRIIINGLSVRETERMVTAWNQSAGKISVKPVRDPDIERLERSLSDTLGAPVSIQHKRGGKGRLFIQYSSLDELDGILERLR